MRSSSLFLLLCALLLPSAVLALEYYVTVDGDGDGTIDSPCSLSFACSTETPLAVIHIANGTYSEECHITAFNVTLQGEPGTVLTVAEGEVAAVLAYTHSVNVFDVDFDCSLTQSGNAISVEVPSLSEGDQVPPISGVVVRNGAFTLDQCGFFVMDCPAQVVDYPEVNVLLDSITVTGLCDGACLLTGSHQSDSQVTLSNFRAASVSSYYLLQSYGFDFYWEDSSVTDVRVDSVLFDGNNGPTSLSVSNVNVTRATADKFTYFQQSARPLSVEGMMVTDSTFATNFLAASADTSIGSLAVSDSTAANAFLSLTFIPDGKSIFLHEMTFTDVVTPTLVDVVSHHQFHMYDTLIDSCWFDTMLAVSDSTTAFLIETTTVTHSNATFSFLSCTQAGGTLRTSSITSSTTSASVISLLQTSSTTNFTLTDVALDLDEAENFVMITALDGDVTSVDVSNSTFTSGAEVDSIITCAVAYGIEDQVLVTVTDSPCDVATSLLLKSNAFVDGNGVCDFDVDGASTCSKTGRTWILVSIVAAVLAVSAAIILAVLVVVKMKKRNDLRADYDNVDEPI